MKKRRPFLLVEVLIAIAIVGLTLIPLLRPHFAVLAAERSLLREIRVERSIDDFLVDRLQAMYENRISWNDIIGKTEFPLEFEGYEGSYRFERISQKGEEVETLDAKAYNLVLLKLDLEPLSKGDPEFHLEQKIFVHVVASR